MPFDGNPEAFAPTEESPVTVEVLRDWLLTRDPCEHYCYSDPGNCLLARYRGHEVPAYIGDERVRQVAAPLAAAAYHTETYGQGSMGAALKRAEFVLREWPECKLKF